jgi:hypothetical protein
MKKKMDFDFFKFVMFAEFIIQIYEITEGSFEIRCSYSPIAELITEMCLSMFLKAYDLLFRL